MTDLNYYETLIAVADDCPVSCSVVPLAKVKKTVAAIQFEMLSTQPYVHTQEDVLFVSWIARQRLFGDLSPADRVRLRSEFFAKPQACLRASPLPKTYGWGFRFDRAGRIALCAMESQEYRSLLADSDPAVAIVKAMRSRRP